MLRDSRMPTYIPLAKIEGKEPLLDYWEVCDDDVIAVSLSKMSWFWYECDIIINLVMMSWYYCVMSGWHHITLKQSLTATCCTRLWLITIKVITVLKLSRWKYVPNYSCTPPFCQHFIPFRCQQLMWLLRTAWEKGHLERYSRGQSRDPYVTPKSPLCWSTPLEFLLPSSSWKVSCELQTHN